MDHMGMHDILENVSSEMNGKYTRKSTSVHLKQRLGIETWEIFVCIVVKEH